MTRLAWTSLVMASKVVKGVSKKLDFWSTGNGRCLRSSGCMLRDRSLFRNTLNGITTAGLIYTRRHCRFQSGVGRIVLSHELTRFANVNHTWDTLVPIPFPTLYIADSTRKIMFHVCTILNAGIGVIHGCVDPRKKMCLGMHWDFHTIPA